MDLQTFVIRTLALGVLGGCGSTVGIREDCSVQGQGVGADLTPPVVRWVSPSDNATVSGLITLTLTSQDDCGVSRVWFAVFNNTVRAQYDSLGSIGYPVTRAADGVTYSAVWDTRRLPNDSYSITAYVEDTHLNFQGMPAGNVGGASLYHILVAN